MPATTRSSFSPDRTTNPDLPDGWTEVRINDEVLQANFVKIALNVVQASSGGENKLHQKSLSLVRRGRNSCKPGDTSPPGHSQT